MPADELQQLKLAFSSKYPSEISDSDSMPGPRMLALLKKNSSADWRFVPWKYRLSCKMHDECELATRPKKVARMEFQDLLLDEVPTREFGHTVGMFMLQSILHLRSVGVALLGLAHLVTFKQYDRAFLQKPSAKYPAGSGLRAPNSVELLPCLRKVGLSMIRSTKWFMSVLPFSLIYSLDQLLLLCLLLPFIREVKARDWGAGKSPTSRGRGGKKGGKGRGSPASGKGTGSDRPPRQEWMARFGTRTLCMLWNQGKCDLENCQYEHLCCVAANGKPCLGNHRAYEHKATPIEVPGGYSGAFFGQSW